MTDETVANHTLRLLQEMRAEMQSFRAEVTERFAGIERLLNDEVQGLHVGLAALRADMEHGFSVTNGLLSGEMATRSFAMKGVEERFLAAERRLTILEARGRPTAG